MAHTTLPPSTYEAAGVNVALGDAFVGRIKALAKARGTHPRQASMRQGAGGYAAVCAVTDQRWVALTTDGVGTKVLLAHELGQVAGLGIDLVAMCANDLICVGATPTLFLDYFATGRLSVEAGMALIESIVAGCDEAGMLLVGGETAEMPDVYQDGHFDLAGFALGELSPDALITGQTIEPGQTLIGMASSGIHSNGLSLARKVLTRDDDKALLLTPTRLYVQPVLSLLKEFPGAITGLAHITGGGWRNLCRLNPAVGYAISAPLPVLPVFEKLLAAGIATDEAYKTFNMGMGLAISVSGDADAMVAQLNDQGVAAQVIGQVTDDAGRVSIPGLNLTLTHK